MFASVRNVRPWVAVVLMALATFLPTPAKAQAEVHVTLMKRDPDGLTPVERVGIDLSGGRYLEPGKNQCDPVSDENGLIKCKLLCKKSDKRPWVYLIAFNEHKTYKTPATKRFKLIACKTCPKKILVVYKSSDVGSEVPEYPRPRQLPACRGRGTR